MSLPLRCQRKLLSSAVFGAASCLFYPCFFEVTILLGDLSDFDALLDAASFLVWITLPVAAAAFLITSRENLETNSLNDAFITGAWIMVLAYTLSVVGLQLFWLVKPPANIPFDLYFRLIYVLVAGAVILLPALPFAMLGAWVYRLLAKRIFSTNRSV